MEIIVSPSISLTDDNNECIKYLDDLLNYLCELFKFSFNIKLEIVDEIDNNMDFDEEVFAGMHYSNGVYIIKMIKKVFSYFDNGSYPLIEGSLFHELMHINDLHTILGCCNLKTNSRRWDSPKDYITSMGYTFWTEFFAYLKTFEYYKNYFDYQTKYQVVNVLKRLINVSYDLMDVDYKAGVTMFKQFHKNINSFIYMLARHMAGIVGGKNKNYNYSKKIKKQMEFKYLDKMIDKIFSYILEISENSGSRKMKNSLYKLGNYLYKRIYIPLGLEVLVIDDKTVVGYVLSSEDGEK